MVVGVNLLKVIPFFGDFLYHALVGGADLGSATLIRFYGWHIFGLILPASIFLVWHIFRLRRDGGIARPPRNLRADSKRIRNVDLVRREVWFFLWVQKMLQWGDPFIWGILIPAIFVAILALIPYIFPKPAENELGRWFPKSNRLAQMTLGVMMLFIIALSFME
ncbi:MAG: hypothetical protein B6I38_09910 [Anaerolineaceae bacterium 4572_5.1]|nr:MAG: hypothetical protein B6I38_09910 [Anaerolineaceae bacterium 4572_5.1]